MTIPPFPSAFSVTMPDWYPGWSASVPTEVPDLNGRMAIVNAIARKNFEEGTGGPFAAGVFDSISGKVIALGVNRVMRSGLTSAHAEVTTLSLAQVSVGTWDLGGVGAPVRQLVVNWRPCIMCMGATIWSGVRELVVAGEGPELEELTGFDEGPVTADWIAELERRGIAVTTGIRRDEAVELFRDFGASDAVVYNGRQGAQDVIV
jgi:tRNA(Arg) A34 adenosine deaminase TadA